MPVDHPTLHTFEAVLPVLQNHLAEIRDVTSRALVQAFIPPSTVRFAPVMYEDSGPATNATIAAISSTCPQRSSAVAPFCGTAQSPDAGVKSVSLGPGWTV